MLNLVKPLVLELLRRIDGSAAIIKSLTQQVTQITMENTTLLERLLAASQVPPATDKEIQALKDELTDRKSTRLNSSHVSQSRMPSSA